VITTTSQKVTVIDHWIVVTNQKRSQSCQFHLSILL